MKLKQTKCSSHLVILGSVSNSQGGNLGCSVTPARTSGLSSTQGIGYGESGKGI